MKIQISNVASALFLFLGMFLIVIPSCDKDDSDESQAPFSVGLIVDNAGIDDKTFNQSTYEGILLAKEDIGFDFEYAVGETADSYAGIIDGFIASGAEIIIAPGFNLLESMTTFAQQNPDILFILLDVAPDTLPANMTCGLFEADEASFLCGFLSAYWASVKDPQQPVAGYVSGPPIDPVLKITTGYSAGIEYFNQSYQAAVILSGASTTDFYDESRAAFLADSLISNGVDVLFSFAGQAGNAALLKAKAFEKWAIGMDADQYYSYPEVRESLLTSCMKNLGTLTYNMLKNYNEGSFQSGQITFGRLENGGVGIAPFHNFDTQIPDSIKQKLEEIKEGIIQGIIDTEN